MQTLEAERENVEAYDPSADLTISDRCDSCGARALAVATLGDMQLYFCSHHIIEKGDKLISQNFSLFPQNWREQRY